MYSVWFCDLEKAIKVFRETFPMRDTFNSIKGNANGDFIFECDPDSFIVKHTDFSIWKFEGPWKKGGRWIKIK